MKVTLRRALMVCVLALILAAGTASAAPKTVDPGTLTPSPGRRSPRPAGLTQIGASRSVLRSSQVDDTVRALLSPFSGVRGREVLRTFALRRSKKFARVKSPRLLPPTERYRRRA